jgi:tetratricopeptide (TPR) repeat protein
MPDIRAEVPQPEPQPNSKLPTPLQKTPTGNSGQASVEKIKTLIKEGHYAEAEAAGRTLLAQVETTSGRDSLAAAELLDLIVESLWRGKVKLPEAREIAERAIAIKEKLLGPDHPGVAASLNHLGNVLIAREEYAGAKAAFERSLAVREKALGPNDPAVATTLSNLAIVHQDMGEYAAARPLLERALAIREKAFGPDDPAVAEIALNLGELLRQTGDYAKAQALEERALAIWEKTLGPEHPHVALVLTNLGRLHKIRGDAAGAKPLLDRSLAISEKVLGPDHPDVARTLSELAQVYNRQGDYAKAKQLYERCLRIEEKASGPESSLLAAYLVDFSPTLENLGDYAEARRNLERALSIAEKALGPNHPQVAATLNALGYVLRIMGEYTEAAKLYERALAIDEKALGPNHTQVADILENLAGALRGLGEFERARQLNERALAIWEKAFGPEDPRVASSLNNLALRLADLGDAVSARRLYERALAIREKKLGPNHSSVAVTLLDLGNLLFDLGNYADAKPLYERSLAIFEKAVGPNHPAVASSLNVLGRLLVKTGDYDTARPLLERSLAIFEKAYGPNSGGVATSLDSLASLHEHLGDYATARALLERGLAIREKVNGPGHTFVGNVLLALGDLQVKTGEYAQAKSRYEEAQAIYDKVEGPESGDAGMFLQRIAVVLARTGDAPGALQAALRGEEFSRRDFRLIFRNVSEREALAYSMTNPRALDAALGVLLDRFSTDEAAKRAVWDAVIRSRALVLDEMAARHRAIAGSNDPETDRLAERAASAQRALASLVVRGTGNFSVERYQALIDTARRETEAAERDLAAKSVAFRQEQAQRRVGLNEVAEALPARSALVAFARFLRDTPHPELPAKKSAEPQPYYLAFVLTSGQREPILVPLGPAREIDALVSHWQQQIAQEASASGVSPKRTEAAYRVSAAALRRSVWDPIAPRLRGSLRVFIVPDGALNLVNFAALPVGETRYVVEVGPFIHYLSTERDLLRSEPASRGQGLLALGAPAYNETRLFASLAPQHPASEASPLPAAASAQTFRGQHSACGDFQSMRFEPLPSSGREAQEIAARWNEGSRLEGREALRGGAQDRTGNIFYLQGAAASEAAFKVQAPGKRILHLATHGFFFNGRCASGLGDSTEPTAAFDPASATGENPMILSGLALAGANHRDAAGPDEDDGILTAEEIAALNLDGVEWAVLSACDTAVGQVRAGEGVFGLRRAFQVAGASTVIMSLWPVEDQSTRAWMRALYDGRFVAGLSTAESVRRASLGLLHARRAKHLSTHPFYWAGFVAAGNWR